MPFATTWMDVEGMRVRETDQRKTEGIPQGILEGTPYVSNLKKIPRTSDYNKKEANSLIQKTNYW